MKKLLIAALALVGTTAAFAQKKVTDVAKFDTETFDFGKIKQSVPAVATFTLTNTSSEPIIIEQASPTCGCTIGDYTKAPIAPGKTGTITATYNAAALGAIHKAITVKLNGIDQTLSLNLAGEVLDETAYNAWAKNNQVKPNIEVPAVREVKTVKTVKATPKKTVKKTTTKKTSVASNVKS